MSRLTASEAEYTSKSTVALEGLPYQLKSSKAEKATKSYTSTAFSDVVVKVPYREMWQLVAGLKTLTCGAGPNQSSRGLTIIRWVPGDSQSDIPLDDDTNTTASTNVLRAYNYVSGQSGVTFETVFRVPMRLFEGSLINVTVILGAAGDSAVYTFFFLRFRQVPPVPNY